MQRDFKGVWIPREVWLSKELSLQEKVFWVEIDSLDNEDGCFAGNEYFAQFFDLSQDRCSEIVSSLKEKGWIEVEIDKTSGKSKRTIRIPTRRKHRVGVGENTEWPLGENTAPNNTSINNTINITPLPAEDGGEEYSVEPDEDTLPTKKWRHDKAVAEGYKGHLTQPILRWAQENYGFKPTNPVAQKTAIATMLATGRTPEQIQAKWSELAEDEFWANKGIDFMVVMSQISKFKPKTESGEVIDYNKKQ